MMRNLAVLASTKPPFVPPDDYHRFSSVVADREAEALLSSHLSFFLTLNKAQPWLTSPCTHISATDSSYDRNRPEDLGLDFVVSEVKKSDSYCHKPTTRVHMVVKPWWEV
ncbi:hypothetical protein ACB092_12G163500 [Castanea dentata]